MTETDYARQKFEPDMKKYYAFWILYQYPQPLHQGRPVSIHAALHTVLLLQLRGGHLFNKIPPLELLARECKDAGPCRSSLPARHDGEGSCLNM